MAQKTPRLKHRVQVTFTDSKGQTYQGGWGQGGVQETYDLKYGAFLRIPIPKEVSRVERYVVAIQYLGEKQYKQTYEQRAKAMASAEKRREKWQKQHEKEELERQEREQFQRRERIVNQIELAFQKQGKDAVQFVTCDKCSARATHLGLAYENSGSQVIDAEQITGAWCDTHNHKHWWPYKTMASIACDRLEFFYDGLRQIVVKPPSAH
jgi:hypothetical protein